MRAPLSLIVSPSAGGGGGSSSGGNAADAHAVSRCVVHHSGALLLEERDSAVVDAQLSAVAKRNPLRTCIEMMTKPQHRKKRGT